MPNPTAKTNAETAKQIGNESHSEGKAVMNVLIATNSDYLMPSRVLFRSLLKNKPCPVRLFVLYRTLSADEMDDLRRDAAESGHAVVLFL